MLLILNLWLLNLGKGNVSWAHINRGYEKVITVLFFSLCFIRGEMFAAGG